MNVIITGAGGFLGRNLAAALSSHREHSLQGYGRGDAWEALAAGLEQADFVYHLAGANRPDDEQEFVRSNVEFTARICSHLYRCGRAAPLLLASSTQAELDNPYGRSKAAAEQAAAEYAARSGARTMIYRLPNVFGKWSRPNYNSVVATFCHNIARDLPVIISDPTRILKLAYVDDVMHHFLEELAADAETGLQQRTVAPTMEITLGELAAQLHAFRASRRTLAVPDFDAPSARKLYATYLSYLPAQEFVYNLDRKCDARGCLAEFVKQQGFGQIFVSRTAPGVTRGNHYHHTKAEKFLVLEGDAIVRLRRMDDADVLEYRVSGPEMRVIDIPPGYTHSLENIGAGELVTLFWAGEIFDPAQPDTYALPVL
jgi:UDP-2-acetamido-2,6-beta-L-arabino-hexul-4-ose reductase